MNPSFKTLDGVSSSQEKGIPHYGKAPTGIRINVTVMKNEGS